MQNSGSVMPKMLMSVDDISIPWIQSVFEYAGIKTATITDISVAPIGHGNASDTVKVILTYESVGADAPASIICKFHSSNPDVIALLKEARTYRIEANMLNLLKEHPAISMPKCYFASVSDDCSESNLVMEDLSEFCKPGDQLTPCTYAEAKSTVIALARFHRQFWNSPVLEQLDWIMPRTEMSSQGLIILRERLTGRLTEAEFAIIERAIPEITSWITHKPVNQTLLHADCRADNVLFDLRDANNATAYLIDWACISIGDALSDVAYFLTSSLSPEDRLAWEDDLLKAHTSEISEIDSQYTIEMAHTSYRENIVSSLQLTLTAANIVPQTPHTDLLLLTLAQRNCAAINHWLNF